MDLVNYDRCRLCLTDIAQLEEEGETVYENYFCECTGSARYICRTCIRLYIPRYPNHCHECRSEWRNVRLIHGPLPYQQFRGLVEREQREGERRWGYLGNVLWFFLVAFGVTLCQRPIMGGVGTVFQVTGEWNPFLIFCIVIVSIYLLLNLFNYGVNEAVDHGFTPFLYCLYRMFGRIFIQNVTDVEIFD